MEAKQKACCRVLKSSVLLRGAPRFQKPKWAPRSRSRLSHSLPTHAVTSRLDTCALIAVLGYDQLCGYIYECGRPIQAPTNADPAAITSVATTCCGKPLLWSWDLTIHTIGVHKTLDGHALAACLTLISTSCNHRDRTRDQHTWSCSRNTFGRCVIVISLTRMMLPRKGFNPEILQLT